MNFLAQALFGGLVCALVSALLAPSYDNNPVAMAVIGFFVGAITQGLLYALFAWMGWLS